MTDLIIANCLPPPRKSQENMWSEIPAESLIRTKKRAYPFIRHISKPHSLTYIQAEDREASPFSHISHFIKKIKISGVTLWSGPWCMRKASL